VHPLIEYAFFLPYQGNLRLNQLCFTNVAHLSYQLARNVKQKLRNAIKVKEDFNIIMLPSSLRNCFTTDMLKISYDEPSASQVHVYKILRFIYTQIMLLGCKDTSGSKASKEGSQVFKVLTKLKPYVQEVAPSEEAYQMRAEASFGKVQICELKERKKTQRAGAAPEYVIEYVDQDHSLKQSKVLNGLTQYYNDVLKDQAKKKTI
jgi:hypothetical protein